MRAEMLLFRSHIGNGEGETKKWEMAWPTTHTHTHATCRARARVCTPRGPWRCECECSRMDIYAFTATRCYLLPMVGRLVFGRKEASAVSVCWCVCFFFFVQSSYAPVHSGEGALSHSLFISSTHFFQLSLSSSLCMAMYPLLEQLVHQCRKAQISINSIVNVKQLSKRIPPWAIPLELWPNRQVPPGKKKTSGILANQANR